MGRLWCVAVNCLLMIGAINTVSLTASPTTTVINSTTSDISLTSLLSLLSSSSPSPSSSSSSTSSAPSSSASGSIPSVSSSSSSPSSPSAVHSTTSSTGSSFRVSTESTDIDEFLNTTQSGDGHSPVSAPNSPGSWQVVAYALSGTTAVLFVAFILSILCICKLRRKLQQATKTLYPISPGLEDGRAYLDLTPGRKKNKKDVRVELTRITTEYQEEVIDSPTFSPENPTFSSSLPVALKRTTETRDSQPSTDSPTQRKQPDDAPQLPVRAKHIQAKSKNVNQRNTPSKSQEITADHKLLTSKSSDKSICIDNPAFVAEEIHVTTELQNQKSSNANYGLYEDDDNVYDTCVDGVFPDSSDLARGMFAIDEVDDIDMEEQRPYEEPVKSHVAARVVEELHRQGSTTGLPDMPLQIMQDIQQTREIPLHVATEHTYEQYFDLLGIDDGLPKVIASETNDDLQIVDDVVTMTEHMIHEDGSLKINTVNNHSNNEDNLDLIDRSVPPPTEDPTNVVRLYTNADMDVADIDSNTENDDEPGLYEDYESSYKKVNSDISTVNTGVANSNRSTIEYENVEGTVLSNGMRTQCLNNERNNAAEEVTLPIVPLRRDILRKYSGNETVVGSFDNMFLTGASPDSFSSIPRPVLSTLATNNQHENEDEKRHGRRVNKHESVQDRDSYFIFMEDQTMILNETIAKRISVAGIPDMSSRDLSGPSRSPKTSTDWSALTSTKSTLSESDDRKPTADDKYQFERFNVDISKTAADILKTATGDTDPFEMFNGSVPIADGNDSKTATGNIDPFEMFNGSVPIADGNDSKTATGNIDPFEIFNGIVPIADGNDSKTATGNIDPFEMFNGSVPIEYGNDSKTATGNMDPFEMLNGSVPRAGEIVQCNGNRSSSGMDT